ncbi:hypothetical protein P5673_013105 [Acropora cervicornis]|uniref:Uncharacterized protein n=1 Tax=Acropora cervicornis TaxID=6130 RepID=A0AAD9QLC9_ACRCE|nr:hypothetical protein P5673_013105 [Acropora cervicornis]
MAVGSNKGLDLPTASLEHIMSTIVSGSHHRRKKRTQNFTRVKLQAALVWPQSFSFKQFFLSSTKKDKVVDDTIICTLSCID